ncbi:MAG: EamA family transporter [Thermoleophilaceae bacterium]
MSSPGTARTQVLTASVLFGTTGTAQALGPGIQPLAVGTARIVVGAALLILVALASGGGLKLGGGDRRLVLLAGLFVASYQASFFAAVAETGVAVGTVVALGSAPAWTGLFGRVFTGERLARRWFVATGLACAGVVLLTLGGSAGGTVSVPGVALALASGAGYAGYAVAGKRLLDRGGTPEGVMAAVFGTGALVLLPALALVPTANLFTAQGIALAAYLGALPTALAYVLFARGLSRIGAGETATLTLAEPVTAMALGFVVLGERPGAAAVAGGALVLAGLAALVLRPEPKLRIRSRPAEAAAWAVADPRNRW